jgi:hypothetical protein
MRPWVSAMKGAWMAEIREAGGSWVCAAELGEMPLAKGLQLTVEGAAPGQEKDVVYEVVGWQYRVSGRGIGATAAVLEITVKRVEEPQGRFARLPDEVKFFGGILLGIAVFAVVYGTGYTLSKTPDHGLVFVGKHARNFGGWVIFGLFVTVLARSSRFARPFFGALLTLTGFLVWGCWMAFAALPAGFDGSDAEYVEYARGLGAALSKSYWPLVVAALPWVSLVAKVLGMERTGKIAEGLEKIGKKREA